MKQSWKTKSPYDFKNTTDGLEESILKCKGGKAEISYVERKWWKVKNPFYFHNKTIVLLYIYIFRYPKLHLFVFQLRLCSTLVSLCSLHAFVLLWITSQNTPISSLTSRAFFQVKVICEVFLTLVLKGNGAVPTIHHITLPPCIILL